MYARDNRTTEDIERRRGNWTDFIPCPKKDLQFSVNNFNKCKRIFTGFGTHYAEDMFY